MKSTTIEKRIGIAFAEWVKAVTYAPKDSRKTMHFVQSGKLASLEFLPTKIPHDLITPKGKNELIEAMHAGLEQTQLNEKIELDTAYKCLLVAFRNEIENARKTGQFDEEAVEKAFLSDLLSKKFQRKTFCIPIVFSPAAKNTNFSVGPIRFQSTGVFLENYESRKSKFLSQSKDDWHYAANECWDHISSFDHILLIEIEGFEKDMAWCAARDLAEAFLNLVRIFYGFYHSHEIKAADGNVKQVKGASLILSESEGLEISLSRDWAGANIDDAHVARFCSELNEKRGFFASYLSFLLSAEQMNSPVRTRLRQANALIAQAYSEPHLDMKLVRIVSALEKLSGITGKNKWKALGNRCASFSAARDLGQRVKIYHSVRGAYLCRNAIVHDETPPKRHLSHAFSRLDKHLSAIFFGFIYLYANVASEKSVETTKHLRKAIDARNCSWR